MLNRIPIRSSEVDLQLPGGERVTEFDAEGRRLESSGVELEDGRLSGSVGRFHVIVVD